MDGSNSGKHFANFAFLNGKKAPPRLKFDLLTDKFG